MLKDYNGIMRDYAGKKFHIVGIGRSGVAAANLLHALGADVRISDRSDSGRIAGYADGIDREVAVFAGRQDKSMINDVECLVLSPGVPPNAEIVSEAAQRSVEVIGEIELSYRVIRKLSYETGLDVRWYGITGTNGKSTTVTLLHEMLCRDNRNSVLSGNIGYPLSAEALRLFQTGEEAEIETALEIVLELSSFQLERIRDLRLDISALLNVTDDHLDRYNDMEQYSRAKAGIFMNQGADNYAVINADDGLTMSLSQGCPARKYYVSTMKEVKGAFVRDGYIFIKKDDSEEKLMKSSDIRIAGLHNLYNALTASLIASLTGVSREVIADVLREFPGLEHRLEFVTEIEGIRFYNDSKGTNAGAVIKSLESFEGNVILIAGGRDKDSNFLSLAPHVKERVKKVIVIGEAAGKIRSALGHIVPVEHAVTLKDAVKAAYDSASSGDTVLLSPACASFDMFRDYEDRGTQFKCIANELLRGNENNE
ncbi:UDP-N-acetylmuramoylalanine--D-glutamate ligase [bacterium BMS3Bbin05]|nr:UDP-N-acetylmuramoylalanine--D-glutamate ligase [bacterium BMS3Bbin05]